MTFDYLLVSPQNSRRLLYAMIDKEIANAQQGQPSGITLKLNNTVDKGWLIVSMRPQAQAYRLIC